jgi:hypothetical protein
MTPEILNSLKEIQGALEAAGRGPFFRADDGSPLNHDPPSAIAARLAAAAIGKLIEAEVPQEPI